MIKEHFCARFTNALFCPLVILSKTLHTNTLSKIGNNERLRDFTDEKFSVVKH